MAGIKDIRIKPIKVMLDKERTINFDLNAFATLEEMYGSIDEIFEQMDKGSMKALRTLLWAGLLHEVPEGEELTEKQVGSWINLQNMPALMAALNQAMEVSLPEGEEGNEESSQPSG